MKFHIQVELKDGLTIYVDNGVGRSTPEFKSTKFEMVGKAIETAKQCINIDDIDIILIGIRNELEKHINEV